MTGIVIPVYTVKSVYCCDFIDEEIKGTYISKDEAWKVLYETTLNLAIDLGEVVTRDEFDENRFNIGSSYYTYIEENTIKVN